MTCRSVGIVGGIASGKSTATRWLESKGWTTVDADHEAHILYGPGTDLGRRIAARFGEGIVREDGSIDRPALGRLVFGDPAALKDLEALVHPAARERIHSRVEAALAAGGRVVLEMALLHRWPEMVGRLELVLGIRCPDPLRVGRLMARSDLDRPTALARLAAQDQDLLLSPATRIVDNDGDLASLEARLREIFG